MFNINKATRPPITAMPANVDMQISLSYQNIFSLGLSNFGTNVDGIKTIFPSNCSVNGFNKELVDGNFVVNLVVIVDVVLIVEVVVVEVVLVELVEGGGGR